MRADTQDLPGDWNCPICGAPKATFRSSAKEVRACVRRLSATACAIKGGWGLRLHALRPRLRALNPRPRPRAEFEFKQIAGFAENQRYGLGTNALTGGQKSGLIYGSLVAFFALFIAGYFMD